MSDLIYFAPGFLDTKICKTLTTSYDDLGSNEIPKSEDLIESMGLIKQVMLEKIVFYLQSTPNSRELEGLSTSEILRNLHQTSYLFVGMESQGRSHLNKHLTFTYSPKESKRPSIVKIDSEPLISKMNTTDPNNSLEFLVNLGAEVILDFEKTHERFRLRSGDLLLFPSSWIYDYKVTNAGLESAYLIANTIAFNPQKQKIIDF